MTDEKPPGAGNPAPAMRNPAPGMTRDRGPEVTFEILGAAHEPFAAQPTLRFELGVTEPTDRPIYAITLTAQINLDPARREYDAETRADLFELFGDPQRWPSTTRSFLWCHASTLVHSFSGATTFGLEVPCTADLEADAEALVVNRMSGEHQHAIVPIDECYRLVGLIKSTWQGISGGSAIEDAVPKFFTYVRHKAGVV